MATTRAAMPLSVAKTISGNSPYTLALPIAATQTFKRGSVVILTAGKVATAAANPGHTNATLILGVAAEDATSIAAPLQTDVMHVWIADQDTIFAGSFFSGASATATANTDYGVRYGITLNGTNWTIDKAKVTVGTDTCLIINDLDRRNDLADPGGLFQFRFGAVNCVYSFITTAAFTAV